MIKDIIVLLARGVEGCGVTKHTVELCKWFEKNNYAYTVVASKDKAWSRKKCHEVKNLQEYKFSLPSEIDKIIDRCNRADLVIVNSLPSKSNDRGKGHGDECVNGFKRILESVNKSFVLIQHDHIMHSIKRNEALKESIDKAKVIFAHSNTGDFATVVNEQHSTGTAASLMNFFEEEKKPFYTFQPGMMFDELREKYWRPIEEQDPKSHKWIGRTTSWKGYNMMLDFHNKYLMPNGYLTTLEGIERSPAFIDFKAKHKDRFINYISPTPLDPDNIDLSKHYGDYAACFSLYKNDNMLKRAAKTGFCYQLSILAPRFIKHSIEYTHCELAAIGTIPVFRKEYGDACIHRAQGKPLTECKDSGTIWLSENNMADALDSINKLSADDVMRDEHRHMAYNFYKEHQDSSYVFTDLMVKIQKHV